LINLKQKTKMTEKTKLIRGILDAATADNLAEAERLIDEYTENISVGFGVWDCVNAFGKIEGERFESGVRKNFHQYIKEKQ